MTKDLNTRPLLTINEAAAFLHVGDKKIRELIRHGYIKTLKLGQIKIRREELDRFLAEAEGYDYSDPSHVVPIK